MEEIIQKFKQSLNTEDPQYLRVKVIPKSPKTKIINILDDGTWKIRLKAVPEKGKANQELVKYLSKLLGVSKNQISIISGQTDRLKLLRFSEKIDKN